MYAPLQTVAAGNNFSRRANCYISILGQEAH